MCRGDKTPVQLLMGKDDAETTCSANAKGKTMAKGATCKGANAMAKDWDATQPGQPMDHLDVQPVNDHLTKVEEHWQAWASGTL